MFKVGDKVHVFPMDSDDFYHDFIGTVVETDRSQEDEGFGPDYIVEDEQGKRFNVLSDNLEPIDSEWTKEDEDTEKSLIERGKRCTTQQEAHDIDIQLERLWRKKK